MKLVIPMKIKEIRKYPIEVTNSKEKIYEGNCSEAPQDIQQLDIVNLNLNNGVLLIKV